MLSTQNILLVLSVVLTALIAGLFYGWACSVVPGIGKLSDSEYIRAMKSMNRAIINPFFMLSFMGTLLVLPIAAGYSYYHCSSTCFYFLLAAALFYIIGGFGLTMACNVPLNDAMENFDLSSANASEISQQRISFEGPWNRYHFIRTLACIASLVCSVIALVKK